jgi:hypothetical protein
LYLSEAKRNTCKSPKSEEGSKAKESTSEESTSEESTSEEARGKKGAE